MSQWPSTRAGRVLSALLRIGWTLKRHSGPHRTLSHPNQPDFVFAFHNNEELDLGCLPELPGERVLDERTCRLSLEDHRLTGRFREEGGVRSRTIRWPDGKISMYEVDLQMVVAFDRT